MQAFFPNARCNFHAAGADAEVQRLLAALSSRQARYRRPGTWKTYLGPWRNAWAWIEPKLRVEMQRETGRLARPTVEDLAAHAHIAHAFAQLRSGTKKIGAVATTCTAINFAMSLHQLPDIMNAFPMKMLREVSTLRLSFGLRSSNCVQHSLKLREPLVEERPTMLLVELM